MSLQQNILVFSIWKGWNEREFLFQATSKLAWHKTGDVKEHSCFMGEKMKVCLYGTETQISFELWASTESKKKIKKKKKGINFESTIFFI